MDFLNKTLKREIHPYDNLELDLNLDSLGKINLLIEIEKLHNVSLNDEERSKLYTVLDLLEILDTKVASKQENKKCLSKENKTLESVLNYKPNALTLLINLLTWLPLRFIFRTLFLLTINGKRNLGKYKKSILCPNHASFLDGPIICASLPWSLFIKTFFLGYAAYFDLKIVRPFKKIFRLIPVDLAKNPHEVIDLSINLLKNNKIICIFPEGKRSITGRLYEFKRGIGVLIDKTNIPVIPVYIKGSFKAWPPYRILPIPRKITVYFGEPLFKEEILSKNKEEEKSIDSATIISNYIKDTIQKLIDANG